VLEIVVKAAGIGAFCAAVPIEEPKCLTFLFSTD
jgi:hypothetical protein